MRHSFKEFKKSVTFICLLLISFVSFAQQTTDYIEPEKRDVIVSKQLVKAKNWIVTTANPIATKAGVNIIKQNGNAIDAMVTIQLMLGLVEPQSSGIGGGAFMVYWNVKKKQLMTYDGRETAPLDATPKLFLDDNGQPMQFYDAVVGGRSVGTPGTLKLLWETHQKYGKLEWKKLIEPVIKVAKQGFRISHRLANAIANDSEHLSRYSSTKEYFFNSNGIPKKKGTLLKNPQYAKTLNAIMKGGADAFYKGKIAKNIINTVQNITENSGKLSQKDFDIYQIKQREPICSAYYSYEVCGMGPPSSGALTVSQILTITEQFKLKDLGPNNPISWQIIADASRLAFADRGMYMADEDFVPMPTQGLLNKAYLKQRAKLIKPGKALEEATFGKPPWQYAMNLALDESIEFPSTSHFNIVDREGNIVSMTTTIENGFGSRLMVDGFLLNNELTDFSFRTNKDGKPIANRLEPGKRPRSSMSPTIIMKDNKPYLSLGSPGGSRIIGYVAQTIIAHTQWGMDIQQAINQPHIINRFGIMDIEKGTVAEKFKTSFEKMGFEVNIRDLNSGLHVIRLTNDGLEGAADSRREGNAIGD